MPPKLDLVFNTVPTAVETDHPAFTVQLSPTKPEQDLSYKNKPATPIIEDCRVETSIPAATSKPTSSKSASSGKRRNRKACFVCKSLNHLIKDCNYHSKKMAHPTTRNHAHRGNHKQYAQMTHHNPQKHMVPTAVLTQSKPVSITVVRQGSPDVPQIQVNRPRHANPIVTKTNSPIRRHMTRIPSPMTSNSPLIVTAVKALVTSNTHHNAIMEAGGKDRPPMLTPGNYVQWKSIIKRYIDTKPNHELIYYCLQNPPYKYKWADKDVPVTEGSFETTTKRYMENYKNVSQDICDQLNAKVEAVQIILTGIDNDIYSTVDACLNACEMWKAIERLKQGESINVQDLETNLYWKFGKFTSRDGESLETYYSRIGNAAGARETIGTTVVQKYGIQCYNCKEYGHVARECQKTKRLKDATYHKEKMLLCKQKEAGFQLNVEQVDWRDDTDNEPDD
nr:hypothetical protein [Tanacetum cinerariifolium]